MRRRGQKIVVQILLLPRNNFLIFCFFISVTVPFASCSLTVTRPKLEMSLAHEAFLSAKEVEAEDWAPQEYRIAELSYIKARSAYSKKYFDKAVQYAKLCIKYSERAEYLTIKAKTIDDRPQGDQE